jgi:very-short-patch-repair endonuclease
MPKGHKEDCQCSVCKAKRGDPHKEACPCAICKAKRGETKRENAPNYGRHWSVEIRKKMGDSHRNPSPETRKKMGDARRNLSPEVFKKIGNANRGKSPSPETCKKNRDAHLQLWQDPEYASKQHKAIHSSPNKPEVFLQQFFDENFPDQVRFVGDGQLIITGKCPDFVHVSKPLLIELFGDYWHKPEEVEPRIKLFESQGYKTLVIWEHELKDIPKLILKIQGFLL